MAKRELLATIRDRYLSSSKMDKSRILDEFIAITGHHRKHASGCLGNLTTMKAPRVPWEAGCQFSWSLGRRFSRPSSHPGSAVS